MDKKKKKKRSSCAFDTEAKKQPRRKATSKDQGFVEKGGEQKNSTRYQIAFLTVTGAFFNGPGCLVPTHLCSFITQARNTGKQRILIMSATAVALQRKLEADSTAYQALQKGKKKCFS